MPVSTRGKNKVAPTRILTQTELNKANASALSLRTTRRAKSPMMAPFSYSRTASEDAQLRKDLILRYGKEEYDVRLSWAFHAWKILASTTEHRNEIILRNCNAAHYSESKTYIGPTILHEDGKKILGAIKATLTKADKEYKRQVFISFAEPASKGKETHFIGLVFLTDIPLLIIFDPAQSTTGTIGIYKAPFLDEIVKEYKNKNYKIQYYETDFVCQKDDRDVYCQTWTLLFMIQKLCVDARMEVPRIIDQRIGYIVSFIKSCVTNPKTAKALREIYMDEIEQERDRVLSRASNETAREKILEYYKSYKDDKPEEFILAAALRDVLTIPKETTGLESSGGRRFLIRVGKGKRV